MSNNRGLVKRRPNHTLGHWAAFQNDAAKGFNSKEILLSGKGKFPEFCFHFFNLPVLFFFFYHQYIFMPSETTYVK